MGLLGNIIKGTVQAATTPLAVAKDIIDVAMGEEPTNTVEHLESLGETTIDGIDDLGDGNLL